MSNTTWTGVAANVVETSESVRIQDLPNAAALAGEDLMIVNQGMGSTATRKTTVAEVISGLIKGTDLSASGGAGLIGYGSTTVEQALGSLQGNYFMPTDLDLTGTTDMSAKIQAYMDTKKQVQLPPGEILADIKVRSGCSLIGSGQKVFDRTSKTWSGSGTLVRGAVSFNNAKNCYAANMSIDTFDLGKNAISAITDQTENIIVERISTRANNHGHLWEQNSARRDGRDGGNIVVRDCITYSGPNGFAVKMRNVQLLRCRAYDVTVQGFVFCSDNINGTTVFSRTVDASVIDCYAEDCNEGLRAYSRDQKSTDNTNNVQPLSGLRIENFQAVRCAGRHIRTGDFSTSATNNRFTRIGNNDVVIVGGRFVGATYSAIRFENANRPRVTGSPLFANNRSNVEFSEQCYNTTVGADLSFGDDHFGQERKIVLAPAQKGTLDFTDRPDIIVFQNTALVYVSSGTGLEYIPYHRCTFVINDDYTFLNITGRTYQGRGVVVEAVWDGTTWTELGATPTAQVTLAYQPALAINTLSARSFFCSLTGNVTSVNFPNISSLLSGQEVTINLQNATGDKTLAGWDNIIKWDEAKGSPVLLPSFRKLLIKLYWNGTSLIEVARTTYV